jgi:choline dehydrogenase-like flavoprotein
LLRADLAHPFDSFILQKGAQFLRRATQQPAFAAFIQSESEPGLTVQTDAQFAEWVKGDVRTEYHPVVSAPFNPLLIRAVKPSADDDPGGDTQGTASMLPRSQNGVVDPNLLVYGTSNVRLVDLSVLPLHLSTHPQSVAYAIAEAAAPIILAAN